MKISVHMITYNHERYIRKAIESVIAQKGDFELELVIGDDVSLDNTRSIIMEFYNRYSDTIKLNFHEKNVGPNNNFKSTLEMCTGNYVAILEGDDYWIDEYKLQKQLDFLERNREYTMCFTKTKFFYEEDGRYDEQVIKEKKDYYDVKDLLKGNFIFHLTCLFRNTDIKRYPEWLWRHKILDYPMHLLRAADGRIGLLDEITAVYRIHNGSLSRTSDKVWWYKDLISILDDFNSYTDHKFNERINKRKAYYYSFLSLYEVDRRIATNLFARGLFRNIFNSVAFKNKVKFIVNLIKRKYK
ncbi:glycosyl transferase [Clostridium zeae]|uniref:Glycosyl transferase n=1 Tax=Clostridium zeae TaxID=2759022 RepID=A0ABQ1EGT1_9CLOT|nr:glycosyltransferase [Clostridium zeae]GFZ33965.1 glycosyl transferase [Clostridium zeae]